MTMDKIIEFTKKDNELDVFGHLQRIRKNEKSEYRTFVCLTKVCKLFNCFMTILNPVEVFGLFAEEINQIVGNNESLHKNHMKFNLLTRREKEIIKLIGKRISRNSISNVLCISKHTHDNHRKHIRQKLKIKNLSELFHFAHSLDLV